VRENRLHGSEGGEGSNPSRPLSSIAPSHERLVSCQERPQGASRSTRGSDAAILALPRSADPGAGVTGNLLTDLPAVAL
jgi:hypothetical protein